MELNLLIADYITNTGDGKQVIGGLYADRRIHVLHAPSDGVQVVLPILSFLATITKVSAGSHQFLAEISKPDGSVLWASGPIGFSTQKEGAANFVFSIAPMAIEQSGMYTFKTVLDDAIFTAEFEMAVVSASLEDGKNSQ